MGEMLLLLPLAALAIFAGGVLLGRHWARSSKQEEQSARIECAIYEVVRALRENQ